MDGAIGVFILDVQVKQAEESATKIESELKDLKETLSNIEGARPFDQLTATDVINARPEIAKAIEEMVKKGKWSLPGYDEKFGSTYAMMWCMLTVYRPCPRLIDGTTDVDQYDQPAILTHPSAPWRDGVLGRAAAAVRTPPNDVRACVRRGRGPRAWAGRRARRAARAALAWGRAAVYATWPMWRARRAKLVIDRARIGRSVGSSRDDSSCEEGIRAMPGQFSGLHGSSPFGGNVTAEDDFPPGFNLARRTSVSAESMSPRVGEISGRAPRAQTPKTESQEQRIHAAVSQNLIFRHLEPEQYQAALLALEEVHKQPGDIVIKQGDQGDYFYIVESGELDVYLQPPGTSPNDALAAPPDRLGNKVVTYGPGATFGELALLYMQPRAASIVATAPCTLWALDRVTFRSILAETNLTRRDLIASFLRQVPLLQHLNDAECERVLDAIEIQDFNPGEVVVREGDMGTHFFLVVNGVAEVLKAGESGAPVTRLQRGDYFGELALMHRAPRAATVRAAAQANMGQLRVAALEEQAFTRLLGPLAGIMARHAETHYHQEGAAPAAAPNTPSKTGQGLLDIPSVGQAPGSPRSGV